MFALIAALSTLTFGPINKVSLPPSQPDFDFVVLGDNRPAGSGQPPTSVYKEILQEVGYIHPTFVLSSGDLVYGNEESLGAFRKELDQVISLLGKLHVPFYNVAGNHEINDRPDFQTEYTRRFGDLYGSFNYGGCRFVAVCTEEVGHSPDISTTQREWLKSTLDPNRATFAFMHHPVFARAGNDEAGATVKQPQLLHDLFKQAGVKAVFEGHDHVYNRQRHDGIDYIISGGAGAPLDALPQDGGFFHFIVVHIKAGIPTYDVLPSESIQVVQDGDRVRVSNYSDADLALRDFTMSCKTRPSEVRGAVDTKGKLTSVPVSIVRVEESRTGYLVHIQFFLTKHRQTILSPSGR